MSLCTRLHCVCVSTAPVSTVCVFPLHPSPLCVCVSTAPVSTVCLSLLHMHLLQVCASHLSFAQWVCQAPNWAAVREGVGHAPSWCPTTSLRTRPSGGPLVALPCIAAAMVVLVLCAVLLTSGVPRCYSLPLAAALTSHHWLLLSLAITGCCHH